MKKIFLVFTAALLISGTAFAGKSSFEVGVTYGNISTINKNNSQNHTDIGGLGVMIGYYEPIVSFLGAQANAFLISPDDNISSTFNGTTTKITNTSYSSLTVPFAFSAELMLALKIPVSIFDISAGAGIGYTLYDTKTTFYNSTTEVYTHQFSVPVFAALGVRLGSFGIKAGCDFQFVFSQYNSTNNKTEKFENNDLNFINVFPYISAMFNF